MGMEELSERGRARRSNVYDGSNGDCDVFNRKRRRWSGDGEERVYRRLRVEQREHRHRRDRRKGEDCDADDGDDFDASAHFRSLLASILAGRQADS